MRQPTITADEIKNLPAVMYPSQFAESFGFSKRYVQAECQRGHLPARLVGSRWYINTKKALELFGIEYQPKEG